MAFIVYDLTLQLLKELKPLIEQVRRHSPSLADQMERAGQSTFLNLAEICRLHPARAAKRAEDRHGSARGKNEAAKLQLALTECREVRAALQLSVAWGYLGGAASAGTDDKLDQVAAILWVLVHRPRRAG